MPSYKGIYLHRGAFQRTEQHMQRSAPIKYVKIPCTGGHVCGIIIAVKCQLPSLLIVKHAQYMTAKQPSYGRVEIEVIT